MNAREAFWRRAQARSASLRGPTQSAILRVFQHIRDNVDDAALRSLIKVGAIEEVVQTALSDEFLDRATLPLSSRIRKTIEKGFEHTIRDLPDMGKVDGLLSVSFNQLNENAVQAIMRIESPVIDSIKSSAREVVRATIRDGLTDGLSPDSISRSLRQYIGIGPDQYQQVRNFRRALRGERDIAGYTLRDKRIDALLEKGSLTKDQIERFTSSYLERRIANNTATVTRTLAFDAYKAGQNLTWEEAQDNGVVPDGFHLEKQWVQIDRPTAREDHVEMNGEQVYFDEPYSNGSMIPGDQGEYNCGCISLVTVEKD